MADGPFWKREMAGYDDATIALEDDHLHVTLADDGFYGVADLSARDAMAFGEALIAAAKVLQGG